MYRVGESDCETFLLENVWVFASQINRGDATVAMCNEAKTLHVGHRSQRMLPKSSCVLGRRITATNCFAVVQIIVICVGDQDIVATFDCPLDVWDLRSVVKRMVYYQTTRPLAGTNDATAMDQQHQFIRLAHVRLRGEHETRFVLVLVPIGGHPDLVQTHVE